MNPWTLALLLVMLPPSEDTPVVVDSISFQALKDTAHLLDLWSKDGYWGTDYSTELAWTQRAFRNCHNAPHVGDAQRLPSLAVIDARLEFSAQYECWLIDQQWTRLYGWHRCDLLLSETRTQRHAWKLMRTARMENEPWNLSRRRQALRELREFIGGRAYYAGEWPQWVSLQEFSDR